MTILYTTNFHVAYADAQTSLDQFATVTQQVAENLDGAMGRAGYTPPDSTSFAALSARVAAIEAEAAVRPYGVIRGATTGSQSLTSGTAATIALTGAEEGETLGGHSTTTNPSRWTCPAGQGGLFLWWGATRIDGATGTRRVNLRKNGTDVTESMSTVPAPSTAAYFLGTNPAMLVLAPGDYVELAALQDSGAAIGAQYASSSLAFVRLYRTA